MNTSRTDKYSFLDDYSEGCHPRILDAMRDSNLVQQIAYGEDSYSLKAKNLIRAHLADSQTPVFFVSGGTLANIIIVASALRSHEAIIAASSGHIVVRETGAIEATGHKIISVDTDNGKLSPDHIAEAVSANAHYPHMAKPRLVYISNASETGTIYSKSELVALSEICSKHDLLLMLDGARLGTALTALQADLTLKDISELTDIFWIGGTKAGALIGEAIVIPNKELATDFAFHIKQRGALLAKGRLLGLQFETLFTDNLFFELSRHSNQMAAKLSASIVKSGFSLSAETQSNQIFPILPDSLIKTLGNSFEFYVWESIENDESIVRLVTSWATPETRVDQFIAALE